MIIAVASGKGGTGKTTVAVNLALAVKPVQFIDCDVEEPNANILLKTTIKEKEDVSVETPVILEERCDHCGRCSDFCAYNALAVLPGKILVFPELCHSCGGCELVCPRHAVKWRRRVIGRIEHGFTDNVDFYQGIVNIGETRVIPVIKTLKQKIEKSRDVIIDAPPGTSCPVIETINSSDYCLLVAEPTPFGLHDLKLTVEMVKKLSIPFGVIINRDGVGDKKLEVFCQKEKIPVLMKIPHSVEIARLYSQGEPFIGKLRGWENMFQRLYNNIKKEVNG